MVSYLAHDEQNLMKSVIDIDIGITLKATKFVLAFRLQVSLKSLFLIWQIPELLGSE